MTPNEKFLMNLNDVASKTPQESFVSWVILSGVIFGIVVVLINMVKHLSGKVSVLSEPEIKETTKADGQILLAIGIVSGLFWFLISDGYHPNSGFYVSFINSMSVYHGFPFCVNPCKDSFWLDIETKYLVLLSVIIAVYGVLCVAGALKGPRQLLWQSTKKP